MGRGRWIYVGVPSHDNTFRRSKPFIDRACREFINQILKPRFLPQIRVAQFNYPVDIGGACYGTSFRFIQRYRSGFPENLGEEFDAPFTRLQYMRADRFDLFYRRPTDEWFRLFRDLTLAEALRAIEGEELLHPL